jgi:hypothetical protein
MIKIKKVDFEKYNQIWVRLQFVNHKKPICLDYYSFGSLHDHIKKQTTSIPKQKIDLFDTIYLIHKWGGVTGRYFLMNKKGGGFFEVFKKDEKQIDIYKRAANLSIEGDPSAFDLFCDIKGIGASFAGKHAYFWSTTRKPLIIIDKLISNFFGFNTPESLLKEFGGYKKLYEYFTSESKRLGLKNVLVLERGIFQYVKENGI